jgi:hypothetical protein
VGVAVCVGVYGARLCAWVGVADGLVRVRMGWVVGRCAGVWCELGGSWGTARLRRPREEEWAKTSRAIHPLVLPRQAVEVHQGGTRFLLRVAYLRREHGGRDETRPHVPAAGSHIC